jgi:hypothetical protein
MKTHTTEVLVNHLTEVQKEVIRIFGPMTEDECIENFDLEDFLHLIEDKIEELKAIKNFEIVEL